MKILVLLLWTSLTAAEEVNKKENIHNVVDFNRQESEPIEEGKKDSTVNNSKNTSQMFCETPTINSKEYDTEEFYTQYLIEYLIEMKSNVAYGPEAVKNVENILRRMEDISAFFGLLKDLGLLESIVENNNRINMGNKAFICFDSSIIYQDINNNKYIIEITEDKYNLLMQLMKFFGKKNVVEFLEKINIKQYIQKETPRPPVKNPLPLSSPIIVSKTSPTRDKNKGSAKSSVKAASSSVKFTPKISSNTENTRAPVIFNRGPNPIRKTPIIQIKKLSARPSPKPPIISYRKKSPTTRRK